MASTHRPARNAGPPEQRLLHPAQPRHQCGLAALATASVALSRDRPPAPAPNGHPHRRRHPVQAGVRSAAPCRSRTTSTRPTGSRETVRGAGLDWRFGGGLRFGGLLGAMAFERPDLTRIGRSWGIPASIHPRAHRSRPRPVSPALAAGRTPLQSGRPPRPLARPVVGQLGLLTHGFRAHHPALGIGWVPGGKTPYGVRER